MSALRSRFRPLSELLVALTGPAIWFVHFSAVYATQGFVCPIIQGNLDSSEASNSVRWVVLAFSTLALLALAGLLLGGYRSAVRDRSDANTEEEFSFLHYLQLAVTGLSIVAVLWTTLAIVLIAPCAPVFR